MHEKLWLYAIKIRGNWSDIINIIYHIIKYFSVSDSYYTCSSFSEFAYHGVFTDNHGVSLPDFFLLLSYEIFFI